MNEIVKKILQEGEKLIVHTLGMNARMSASRLESSTKENINSNVAQVSSGMKTAIGQLDSAIEGKMGKALKKAVDAEDKKLSRLND
ncbi:hypothetical protein FEI15_01270 [Lacticaseibacillus zeae]|uniref:Uncharacterized protein n=1 Tax=Lacticaseibacillus zeae TaxID=57037 RepID=A0A5R8M0Z1_LACZE|nr:hypothetical protein [Lacticaseibacillus zeae]TLF41869.1 hypothetical protein FEI15_01270 [Lacticaseibacillus zeae]